VDLVTLIGTRQNAAAPPSAHVSITVSVTLQVLQLTLTTGYLIRVPTRPDKSRFLETGFLKVVFFEQPKSEKFQNLRF